MSYHDLTGIEQREKNEKEIDLISIVIGLNNFQLSCKYLEDWQYTLHHRYPELDTDVISSTTS